MSSFQGTEFRIVTFQGRWPLITRDEEGVPRYRATIRMETEGAYKALADLVVQAQPVMALGAFIGKVRVLRKRLSTTVAEGDLIVPIRKSELGAFTAVLTSFVPETFGRRANLFEADAEWIITSTDITP